LLHHLDLRVDAAEKFNYGFVAVEKLKIKGVRKNRKAKNTSAISHRGVIYISVGKKLAKWK
jgi:hypothetical protein